MSDESTCNRCSRRSIWLRVLLIWVIFALASLARAQACEGTPNIAGADRPLDEGQLEQAVFNAVVLHYTNAQRCNAGLPPLQATPGLVAAAANHALNMAADRNFSHTSRRAGQRTLSDRLRGQNARFRRAGENIAMNFLFALSGRSFGGPACNYRYAGGAVVPRHSYRSLAQEVVAGWMASPPHRANIMSRQYRLMGAGVGLDRAGQMCGQVYIAQVFVGN